VQDADLIFLTLAQHEPRFSILREEVSSVTCFVCHKVGHISTDCPQLHPEEHKHDNDEENDEQPPELRFQWVHTQVLREYLDREFRHLSLSFPYSLERVIDDFIIICFLAGNDFLPRLPSGTPRSTTISSPSSTPRHQPPPVA
jgi:5'-3' exoribonuclease 2